MTSHLATPRGRANLPRGLRASAPCVSAVREGIPPDRLLADLIEGTGSKPALRVERIWPDKDGRARFEWTVAGPGNRRHSIFGVPLETKHKQTTKRGRLTRSGIFGLRAACPEFGLYFHGADTDPRLPHLAECLNPATLAQRLEALGFQHDSDDAAPRVRARLLAHKPGRRAVILYELPVGRSRLVGKTYRDDRAARVVGWSRELAAQFADRGTPVRIPQPLGLDRELKMSLSTWCNGRGETSAIGIGPRLSTTARILATLHGTFVESLPPFSVDEECAIAIRWSQLLRRFAPRRADRAKRLTERLIAWSKRLDSSPPQTIHRDFYEKQLIWSGRVAHLLDLDTLAAGDPALDVGNFIGHMLLNRASAGLSIREIPAIADAFVEDYRRAGASVRSDHVAFYWASSLVRGGAIHALRDATRVHARSMWDMGEALLDGSIRLSAARQSKKGAGR